MNVAGVQSVSSLAQGAGASPVQRPDALRQRIDEFVGLFFYGTMLKGARAGRLTKSPYGFGGRGEETFAAQLDQELALRMGRASHNSLSDAMYRRLASPGRFTDPGTDGNVSRTGTGTS